MIPKTLEDVISEQQNFQNTLSTLSKFIQNNVDVKTGEEISNLFAELDFKPFEFGLYKLLIESESDRSVQDYNLLHYEELLESAIDGLVTAISLRDDAMELSHRFISDAVQRAREEIDLSIRESTWLQGGPSAVRLAGLNTQRSSLSKIVSDISPDAGDLVALESKKIEAELLLIDSAISELLASKEILEKEISARRVANKVLMDRSSLSGSALQYKERIGILKESFAQVLVEAFWRLRAFNFSVNTVYGEAAAFRRGSTTSPYNYNYFQHFPMPNGENEVGFIDSLLRFARHSVNVLKVLRRDEQAYRIRVNPTEFSENDDEHTNYWAHAMKHGAKTTFRLDEKNFSDLTSLRLLSLSVLFHDNHAVDVGDTSAEDHVQARQQTRRCEIILPEQAALDKRRPVVQIADASEQRAEHNHTVGQAIKNASPIGEWSIFLHKDSSYSGSPREATAPEFLFIELLVMGSPKAGF